jgi:hypothetical protein
MTLRLRELTEDERTEVQRITRSRAWGCLCPPRPDYAVVDNLSTHSAPDVRLFSLLHPRWEFVFQPKYVAYLNLIEPWWKVLRSLALKGRRFETWAEIEQAVERATAYWNSIPSSGDAVGAIGNPAVSVWRLSPLSH